MVSEVLLELSTSWKGRPRPLQAVPSTALLFLHMSQLSVSFTPFLCGGSCQTSWRSSFLGLTGIGDGSKKERNKKYNPSRFATKGSCCTHMYQWRGASYNTSRQTHSRQRWPMSNPVQIASKTGSVAESSAKRGSERRTIRRSLTTVEGCFLASQTNCCDLLPKNQ